MCAAFLNSSISLTIKATIKFTKIRLPAIAKPTRRTIAKALEKRCENWTLELSLEKDINGAYDDKISPGVHIVFMSLPEIVELEFPKNHSQGL